MKNIIPLLIILLSIFSCETIDGPYMIDNHTTPIDTTSEYEKKILIEDFTAHKCKNCPDAARELKAIHNLYGDKIIGIAIHTNSGFATPTAMNTNSPNGFTYDFRTEYGSNLCDDFIINEIPKGMINRIGYPDNHRLNKTEWLSVVQSELLKPVDFGIQISSSMSSEDIGEINITTEIINNISGNYKLAVCLVENNIINWQVDGNTETSSYEHNHVLRTVLENNLLSSSTDYISGELINITILFNLLTLQDYNVTYSNNLPWGNGNAGGWKRNNIQIIAYIYNVNNYEILQVEEAPLTQ